MAFHAPMTLPNIVSAASELWPSISAVAQAPWRQLSRRQAVEFVPNRKRQIHTNTTATEERAIEAQSPVKSTLPDCLSTVSISSLQFKPTSDVLRQLSSGAAALPSRHLLYRCNPLFHRLSYTSAVSRPYSTLTKLGPFTLRPIPSPGKVGLTQRRTFFGGNRPNNQLARIEQAANNNPKSAPAQNAFYVALLSAGMPQIVVERYATGRFATNAACDANYIQALGDIGQTGKAATVRASLNTQSAEPNLSQQQITAVTQAVAANVEGTAVTKTTGQGSKDSPLHVVVDESLKSVIFKYLKFALWFGLIAYVILVAVSLFIETTGLLRKVGGTQHAEARPELQTTRFSDVHGCEEAKEELQEIVEFLKAPEKFSTLGGKLPKGILLVGPPGTGKTLLARAVAGEAGVPFFYMSGSEFDEVYVGVGAKRVRELFNAARSKAPAIVFIDEVDAIGGKRNERDAAYVKQTLNQLLTDLDGFDQNSGVIFIAATNFPELLDKALTRPGRFDRNVVVPLPDVRGRVAILKHHMKNVQIGTDVDAAVIARGTPGFSGAELENIVNIAAVHASKQKAKKVHMQDFEWARDRVLMGAERRSTVIQEKDKLMTAYHEGGHALVAMFTKYTDPLYKATIMPRGHALGMTTMLPEMDRVSVAKRELLAKIDVCMGGKVAEELIYGPDEVTSGASSDIQNATSIAYAMVTQMGMSDKLGNVDLDSDFGRLSTRTKETIEGEVRRLVEEGRERATKLLLEKRKELDLLAKALVAYETLNREEMEKVVRGEKLPDRLQALASAPMKIPDMPIPASMKPPQVPSPSNDEDPGAGAPNPGGPGAFPAS